MAEKPRKPKFEELEPLREGVSGERHFLKSADFKSIYAHGVWGGTTPRAEIHMAFFTERPPLPQCEILPDDKAQRPVREGKSGLVRDISTVVLMDLPTAVTVHKWLGRHIQGLIEQLEKQGVEIPDEWHQ